MNKPSPDTLGGTTSDNIRLSDPPHPVPDPFAIDCNSLAELDPKLAELVEAAHAANTRRAYRSDLEHFLRWGGSVPSSEHLIARYLADHATSLSVATLSRRLAAIGQEHLNRGLANPARSNLVRLTLRGIRRKYPRPQRQVSALLAQDIAAIVSALDNSTADQRDAALLLVGFTGALRRSELSALDVRHLEFDDHGLIIHIARSKTDQESIGRKVRLIASSEMCPASALRSWLLAGAIHDGPVFRSIVNQNPTPHRLSAGAIARIIKQRVKANGHDPSAYSGHSLRSGFVSTAVATGIPLWRIKAQTGHRSDTALSRYIREAQLLNAPASAENWTRAVIATP
jgi:integrase